MQKEGQVITRIAPSPTGFFHVGTLRTALFNYLYAKKHGGHYLLRIEDTDKLRSKKEYEDDILASLKWLGIEHDRFFRQSEHLVDHKIYLEQLIKDGRAYASEEKARDKEGNETDELRTVIRFRNPGETVKFHDLILGDIEVDTSDLGDFVIAKDMDTPLYNFAVVVDDANANITHVIRGQDHVSNTPRQILMYKALGKSIPEFAHLPLILAADRSKLSKRKHGESVSVRYYREEGYLPEALINFVAHIGWNEGTEQELYSLDELVRAFDIERVQKSAGIFNVEKLNWINKEYMKKLPAAQQEERILAYLPERIKELPGFSIEKIRTLVPLIMERIEKFGDVRTMAQEGELDFFFVRPALEKEKMIFKGATPEETKEHLKKAREILAEIAEENWAAEHIKDILMKYADTLSKRGPVLHPLRYALSGLERSPDPFTIAGAIGKEETMGRLDSSLHAFFE